MEKTSKIPFELAITGCSFVLDADKLTVNAPDYLVSADINITTDYRAAALAHAISILHANIFNADVLLQLDVAIDEFMADLADDGIWKPRAVNKIVQYLLQHVLKTFPHMHGFNVDDYKSLSIDDKIKLLNDSDTYLTVLEASGKARGIFTAPYYAHARASWPLVKTAVLKPYRDAMLAAKERLVAGVSTWQEVVDSHRPLIEYNRILTSLAEVNGRETFDLIVMTQVDAATQASRFLHDLDVIKKDNQFGARMLRALALDLQRFLNNWFITISALVTIFSSAATVEAYAGLDALTVAGMIGTALLASFKQLFPACYLLLKEQIAELASVEEQKAIAKAAQEFNDMKEGGKLNVESVA